METKHAPQLINENGHVTVLLGLAVHDDAHRKVFKHGVAEQIHDTSLLLGVRDHKPLEDAIVLPCLAFADVAPGDAVVIEARTEDPSLPPG